MDTDLLFSLLAEVIQGIGADKSALPDTAEVRAKRAELQAEVAETIRLGYTPDVPHEWATPGGTGA